MGKAADFYKGLNESMSNAIKRIEPFRALVKGTSTGKVQIQTLDADTPLSEYYARLAGPKVQTNDEVAVITLGGQPFVLGKIQRTTPSGLTYEEKAWIQATDIRALRVADNADNIIFAVDTTAVGKSAGVYRGAFLTGFSDTGGNATFNLDASNGSARFDGAVSVGSVSTPSNKWAIDSGNGNARFDGTVSIDGRTASSVTLTPSFFDAASQAASDVGSTTSTTTMQTAMTMTHTLPAGTWSVYVVAGQQLRHSTSGNVSMQVNIGSKAGDILTNSFYTDAYAQGICTCEAGGQSGTIVVRLQYRSSTAGTTTSKMPWMYLSAVRTG